jgi:hypothetical protein
MSGAADSLTGRQLLLMKQAAEQRESYKIAQKGKSHTRAQRALEQAQRLEAEAHEIGVELARQRQDAELLQLPEMSDDELIAALASGLAALPAPLIERVLVALIGAVGDGPVKRALAPPLALLRGGKE